MTAGSVPPPPRDTTREIKRALRTAELAPASWLAQLAAYLQIVLAIGLCCAWSDQPLAFVSTSGALGAGVLIGTLTPIGGLFRDLSGMIAALVVGFVAIVLLGFSDGRLFGDDPWLIAVVVALAALGLDWRFVPRLRARAVASGLLVIPLVGADESWALAGAVGWFVGLLLTLWLLERDVGRAALRPVPLIRSSPGDPPPGAMDVVRAAGVGLAIGLVAALLFGDATCSLRREAPAVDVSGPLDLGSSPEGGDGFDYPRLDASGREYEYRVDALGRPYVPGADGSRTYVEERDGRTELHDESGNVVAEISGNGVTVFGPDGDSQSYGRGPDGSLTIEGDSGQQYTLEPDGSGWVLRDGSGDIVTRTDASISRDHLYLRDPEGNVLVPDDNGDGRIPVPDLGGSTGPFALDERSYERDAGGRIVVTDPDGSTRTYDRDALGRDRVTVQGDDGTRTFVYDDSGSDLRITEYDDDGNVVDEYVYDPQGRSTGPDPADGPRSAGSSSEAGTTSRATPSDDEGDDGYPWAIVAIVAAVVAALAVLILWARRRGSTTPRPNGWAERLAQRLAEEGRSRGRARGRGETVLDHSAALADGPLPDPRVATVGRILSSALFGRREPPPDTRQWAEHVVDEVSNAHPPPSRRATRRRRTAGITTPP